MNLYNLIDVLLFTSLPIISDTILAIWYVIELLFLRLLLYSKLRWLFVDSSDRMKKTGTALG
jgi:hypothetical protein